MQQLTAAPRDALTAAQVVALLQADALGVDVGLEQLDSSDRVVADLSGDLVPAGSEIERNNTARVPGTCKLNISRALTWGSVRVRPYMTLSAAGVSARWDLGVFVLTTPDRPAGETPQTFAATGYDKLYFLDQAIGDSYSVSADANVLGAVRAVIEASGAGGSVLLDGSASDKTLPADMVWTLNELASPTYLQVVNDLLATIGYRGVWADELGAFRSEPSAPAATRPVEFSFSAEDPLTSLIGVDRTETQDLWPVPNWWRFVQRGLALAPTEGLGQYTVTTPDDDPTSAASLGYVKRKVMFLDAVDQDSLVAQGDQQVAADRQVAQVLKVSTAPFPPVGHLDVYSYADVDLGGELKVQASSWTLPLDGSDMSHEWRVVS